MTLTRIGATELLYRRRSRVTGSVLELGVGESPYSYAWQPKVTLDINPLHRPTVVADAHCCPFRDGSFDTVVASQVFEHLSRPWEAAEEVGRILRPGGRIVVAVPFLYWLHEHPADYYRYTEWGIRSLFENQFEIEEICAYGGRFAATWDLLATMTRGSTRLRKGLFVIRSRFLRRLDRGKRRPFTANLLLRMDPKEYPLGYVMTARRRQERPRSAEATCSKTRP